MTRSTVIGRPYVLTLTPGNVSDVKAEPEQIVTLTSIGPDPNLPIGFGP